VFLCVSVFYCFNCSIYVVIFSTVLAADVSALVPFCPAQFNVTHCLHWYDYFELINDIETATISQFYFSVNLSSVIFRKCYKSLSKFLDLMCSYLAYIRRCLSRPGLGPTYAYLLIFYCVALC